MEAVTLDLSRYESTSQEITRRIQALNKLQVLVLDENYLSGDLPLDQMASMQQSSITRQQHRTNADDLAPS
jgi:hypothetical protein